MKASVLPNPSKVPSPSICTFTVRSASGFKMPELSVNSIGTNARSEQSALQVHYHQNTPQSDLITSDLQRAKHHLDDCWSAIHRCRKFPHQLISVFGRRGCAQGLSFYRSGPAHWHCLTHSLGWPNHRGRFPEIRSHALRRQQYSRWRVGVIIELCLQAVAFIVMVFLYRPSPRPFLENLVTNKQILQALSWFSIFVGAGGLICVLMGMHYGGSPYK